MLESNSTPFGTLSQASMSLTWRKSDFTVSLGRLRFCLSPSEEGWSLISTLEPSKMQVSPMSSDCGILCGKSRKE